MKRFLQFLFLVACIPVFAQEQTATFSINPAAFDEDEQITITVSGVDPTIWNAGQPDNIYLWAWYFDSMGNFAGDSPTNGDWTNSNDIQQMTNNGNGTYSYTLTPDAFYGDTGISQIGMLVKAKDGTGDKKSQDFLQAVGRVQVTITNPTTSPVIINSGDNLPISAFMETASGQEAGNFTVFLNNVQVASGIGTPNFSTTLTNVTEAGEVRVEGTPFSSSDTGEATFDIVLAPTVTEQNLPPGVEDGINYDPGDATRATLVLNAPGKEFIYVAADWNGYNPGASDLMRRDPSTGKYWLEITGLTGLTQYTYQYWVYDMDPVAGSPTEVKTADPFSTLVASPFDDPFIPASTYPSLPTYPAGQEREVTVLETGRTPYNWQVPNFNPPKEEDLIVYELLVRDFDADRNYQDLIDRIDYFVDLNINAIELMPVMEFEGNESWGYNTAFHLALDKFYGTEDKFKEFIDLCHQNGIAVILDLALNHAFGRNPMVRMWMDDPDGDGWGGPSSDNPYFNQNATHSYSVGSDFDHSQAITQYYTERVVKHWIEEFKIDGFRWDLTKGFTQNCTASDEGCTNSYQQDRVDRLIAYADYSWGLDPDHYVIFEHLGQDNEESVWANHRLGEGKGIMMWGKITDPYNELTMGQGGNKNFDRMGHLAHTGFSGPRVMGYAESHDEERLMYKNLQFGASNGGYNIQNLNTALGRMPALGAVTIPIPGPKMIWHFGELGMENSIFTCPNGSVNPPGGGDGDCKLDTKPQPQWMNNWLGDPNRAAIYDSWSRLNALKINEDVFEGNYSINSGGFTPRIFIWDDAIPSTMLKNVVILTNFNTSAQNVTPDFPYTGIWYDLMDETGSTSINVTNTTSPINLQPGEFKIYGNAVPETLSTEDFEISEDLKIFPNPVSQQFSVNKEASNLEVYDITGKLVQSFSGQFESGRSYDISGLSQGMYIVKIKNESGFEQSAKLIKL